MSDDPWTARLSEYLDGTLSPEEREELEAHLVDCSECGTVLEDLREVVSRARALPDRPPSADLWPGIEARLGPGPLAGEDDRRRSFPDVDPSRRNAPWRRRLSFSVGQLAAAAIVLVAFSGSAVWLALGGEGGPAAGPAGSGDVSAHGSPAAAGSYVTAAGYETAVEDLETLLRERRDELGPTTVRVVEKNLQIIDRAIEEARDALEEDPASPYLNAHLADAMMQKLRLLRRAAALPGAAS